MLEGRAFAAETLRSLHAGGIVAIEILSGEIVLVNTIQSGI
jgi:hypothetical protein